MNLHDDGEYVINNPFVRSGLTSNTLNWDVTNSYANLYAPLTWLSFQLEVELFGLNSEAFHRTNLLLHIMNVLLVFALLESYWRRLWQSFAVAALFAVHPLRVESVAWITERKDVLYAFWFLLSVAAYARFAERACCWSYAAAFLAFTLSLLSKPMGMTLPAVLLILDGWPLQRWKQTNGSSSTARLLLEKIPFFALSLVWMVVTVEAQQPPPPTAELPLPSVTARLLHVPVAFCWYLVKAAIPTHLTAHYPTVPAGLAWKTPLAVLALTAITVWAWRSRTEHPHRLAGWAWYLVTLSPVVGWVQLSLGGLVADRFGYLPLLGVFLVAGCEAEAQLRRQVGQTRTLGVVLGLGVLLFCVGRTRQQCRVWQDDVSLWSHTVANTTSNPHARDRLGSALLAANRFDEAAEHFAAAVAGAPRLASAHNNLGVARVAQNRLTEAVESFRAAVAIVPDFAAAHVNLGTALLRLGRHRQAIEPFERAIQLQGASPERHFDLARALAGPQPDSPTSDPLIRQNRRRAADLLRSAADLRPTWAAPLTALGNLAVGDGQSAQAETLFRQALQREPDQFDAAYNLGNLLHQQRRFSEAQSEYRRALRTRPTAENAWHNLGLVLAEESRWRESADAFRNSLQHQLLPTLAATAEQENQLRSARAETLNSLGWVLWQDGQLREAEREFRSALSWHPSHVKSQLNLRALRRAAAQGD